MQLEHTVVASSSTSRTVTLEATRGACDEEQPPSVVETAEQVRVVLTVLRSGEACTDQGVLWRPQIVLREPLGDRPVVPGP